MYQLPVAIEKAIRRYEKIETGGLTLYPVLVKEYSEHLIARPAVEVMHQSLPVALMRMPLLSALYQIDYAAAMEGKPPTGLFSRTLLALALSLRLGTGLAPEQRVGMFQVAVDRRSPDKLKCLRFTDSDGKEKEIRPEQYAQIRQIIAAQNGIRLESEQANPDIVRAKRDMAASGSLRLDTSIEDLITATALFCHVEESEIEDWAILKLNRRSDAIRRVLSYLVCGIGEMQGTTWNGGNPAPHPFFRRQDEGNGLFSAMGNAADGAKQEPPTAARILAETSENF